MTEGEHGHTLGAGRRLGQPAGLALDLLHLLLLGIVEKGARSGQDAVQLPAELIARVRHSLVQKGSEEARLVL